MLPPKLIAKTNRHTEHEEQTRLILFVTNCLMHEYPVLRWLHSIPNGLSFKEIDRKTRAKITTQMTSEGVKSGVCDLFLPVKSKELILKKIRLTKEQQKTFGIYKDEIESIAPRYSGLYIEMKSKTGTLSVKQQQFIASVREEGFKVVVPRSADEALAEIVAYCGLPSNIKIIDELVAA